MASVVGLAGSGERKKLKEVQPLSKVSRKAGPTFVIEVIDLFREFVEMRRDNAKLADHNNNLVKTLDGV